MKTIFLSVLADIFNVIIGITLLSGLTSLLGTSMANIRTAIRIQHQGHIAIGPGKADLLEAIMLYGSISGAAKSMKMSYKRAWDLVTVMNTAFQAPLVTTIVGGTNGGGATLTELGQEVLRLYRDVQMNAEVYVENEMQALINRLNKY